MTRLIAPAWCVLVLLLAGCAHDVSQAPVYDDEESVPAIAEQTQSQPAEMVPVPQPLPLPGQVKTIRPAVPPDPQEPLEVIAQQRSRAKFEPTNAKTINAITIYPYVEGSLYQLYAAPEQVTDIALQPGEMLKSVAAGDTVRWVIGDTASGAGAGTQVHILVKPFAGDLATNLVILTDRRAYHLELTSTNEPGMSAIAWTYPRDELIALTTRNEFAAAQRPIGTGLSLEALRFRYHIEGDAPSWRPLAAFDDGSKVYIQFPLRIYQGEMPPLFVLGPRGKAELVNYRVRRNYYIVDRLFGAAELRMGEDPQQVVRILRTDQAARHEGPRETMPSLGTRRER